MKSAFVRTAARRPSVVFAGFALLAVPAPARAAPTADAVELRAGAWDRSVELEREGKLKQARDLLILAWGEQPESYELSVRLAWLSLQLGESSRAIAAYRRARNLPGAGPEASRGLASALVQRGFDRLERNEREAARQDFHAALEVDVASDQARLGLRVAGPSSHLDPELWVAYLSQFLPKAKWHGGSVFAHLPWQVDDRFRLRAAFRYLRARTDYKSEQAPPGGSPLGDVNRSENQQEVYGGLRYGSGWMDVEALGIGVFSSRRDAVPGAGLQARAGARVGSLLSGVLLEREDAWSGQFLPGLYYWPGDSVGLAAGARFTADAEGHATSGWAGLSWCPQAAELHVHVYRGTERWAFSPTEPSILTIDAPTVAGGRATLLAGVSEAWQLGVQFEMHKLDALGEPGLYVNAGLGLRWSVPVSDP